jgi:hypothetical protein
MSISVKNPQKNEKKGISYNRQIVFTTTNVENEWSKATNERPC